MLSDDQAVAMEGWVTAAHAWGEAAQGLVGAASGLAVASRSLADEIDGSSPAAGETTTPRDNGLEAGLRSLAVEVEDETAGLRDRYLATASNLEQYRQVMD